MKLAVTSLLFFMALVACSENKSSTKEDINEESETENLEHYFLDITGKKITYDNQDKDEFKVEQNLFVADSSFGVFSDENYLRAAEYAKNNSTTVFLIYDIKMKGYGKNEFKPLFLIQQPTDLLGTIELDQGYSTESGSKYLRVIQKFSNGSLDRNILNFTIKDDNTYNLLSKERIKTQTSGHFESGIGYCIDTVNKAINEDEDTSLNEIHFTYAFYHTKNNWVCNQSINNS